MQTAYYVSHDSKYLGPFTLVEIKKMVSTQQLNLQDKAFLEGRQDWVPLHSLPGFQLVEAAAPVPAAASPASISKPESKPESRSEDPKSEEQMTTTPLSSETAVNTPPESPKSKSTLREVKLASPQSVAQKPVKPAATIAALTAKPSQSASLSSEATPPVIGSANANQNGPALNTLTSSSTATSPSRFNEAHPNELWSSLNAVKPHQVVLKPLGSESTETTPPPTSEVTMTPPALITPVAPAVTAAVRTPVQNQKNTESAPQPFVAATNAEQALSGQTLQLVNGRAILTLEDLKLSGDFVLQLDTEDVAEVGQAAIAVQPGQVNSIDLKMPERATVGEKILAQALAKDQFGNLVHQCESTFGVEVTGSAQCAKSHSFRQGVANFEIVNTVAESVEVRIVQFNAAKTPLPTRKMSFSAGPAVKLVVVTPESTIAGEKVKVEVRALDQFGNLSDNCSSKLNLKILKKGA